MNVLIIEDEKLAANRLSGLIKNYDNTANIIGALDSIKASVAWFSSNPQPDLAFLDIQLADGLSFEIFDQVVIHCPVIFTTAFDEYALRAFKVNSIDYLLKPIDPDELSRAMDKFSHWHQDTSKPEALAQPVMDRVLQMLTKSHKSRFLVRAGEHIKTIPAEQVTFFYSMEKATFLNTIENKEYDIDYTLEELEDLLNPELFFRINRKYIVSMGAIRDIINFTNSRLKLRLVNSNDNEIIVSREKVAGFKNWLDR
jgi:DNA-binding LytR/AlgR family response regulator